MVLIQKEEKTLTPGDSVGAKFGAGKAAYKLIIDSTQSGVEEKYFWAIRYLEKSPPYGRGYTGKVGEIIKIKDVYTAGEASSYWGAVEQKRGAQIDKFQQIMANIGNMLKALFQLLRELRILDERLDYYDRSSGGEEAAEVALKSIWVDLVEGGGKSASSVIGLASQVGFVTLPDLFYSIHPKSLGDIDRDVDKLKEGGINRKVREVLKRKLFQYLTWKEKTYRELRIGKDFKLKYMRQHYHIIRLYLNWLRPYLRNIRRLQMKETLSDKDIVAAFDTSKIELEILAIRKEYEQETFAGNREVRQFAYYFPCVRVRINYVGIPEMVFQQDYQRGAVHRGRTELIVEGFVTTQENLEAYKKSLDAEDLELLAAVDSAILALKEDLEYYLEKGGELKKEEEAPMKREGVFTPFTSIFRGFKEMIVPQRSAGKPSMKSVAAERGAAAGLASLDSYVMYKVYKQSHGMMVE